MVEMRAEAKLQFGYNMPLQSYSIRLPFSFRHSVLAVGSETNTSFSLLKKNAVFVSRSYNDLKTPSTFEKFKKDITGKEKALSIKPCIIACDLHPEYMSVKYAKEISGGNPVEVQHHHAHTVSCMAENGIRGKVISVAFDGTGYGQDAGMWGGEFLAAGYDSFKRAAHIASTAMPGGDKAVLEPIRMAFSYLHKTYEGNAKLARTAVLKRLGKNKSTILKNMIEKKINSPRTSSAGRLCDAVSSLIGIKDRVSFEGEAAIALEAAAEASDCRSFYDFALDKKGGAISVNFDGMIREIVREIAEQKPFFDIARKFHNTLAEAVKKVCIRLRREYRLNKVVLTGGVFQNNILFCGAKERLTRAGFLVYSHHNIPASDAGLSLGQAVIAASKMEHKRCA